MIKIDKLFCDMDGVLVDFIAGTKRVLGYDMTNPKYPQKESWDVLEEFPRLWETMPWVRDGKKLWNHIQYARNLEMLTALPYGGYDARRSQLGKVIWCVRELGVDATQVNVVQREHKADFAADTHLLIDDTRRNCQEFIQNGGHAIHHTDAISTIEKLKEYDIPGLRL